MSEIERDDYDFTPRTLRNRGVQIKLARTERLLDANVRGYSPELLQRAGIDAAELPRGAPQVVFDGDGDMQIETVFVRFDHNVLADLEELYGSIAEWQKRMDTQPIGTVRQTLASMLRRDVDDVGLAMLDGERLWYENAIGVAWALANGLDPTRAAIALSQSVEVVAVQREQSWRDVAKIVDELLPKQGIETTPTS